MIRRPPDIVMGNGSSRTLSVSNMRRISCPDRQCRHRYSDPATGVYQFNATITLTSAVAGAHGSLSLYAKVNGAIASAGADIRRVMSSQFTPDALTFSFLLKLNANDAVTLAFQNISGQSVSTNGGQLSVFSGYRVN